MARTCCTMNVSRFFILRDVNEAFMAWLRVVITIPTVRDVNTLSGEAVRADDLKGTQILL
jgi:hypothetical protein